MAKPIPDRWLNYSPIGQRVSGTRFIAFKVPLRQHINERVEEHLRLAPESLLESVPNLGLIIDLTNTNRYYSASDFNDRNVEHQKLMIPGKMTPAANLSERFCKYVSDYLRENENNDKLIGVHCTHGVNRTGYMICYFMINVLKMEPEEAIQSFAAARGHEIERNNYIRSLKEMTSNEVVPQPIINWRQQAEEYRKYNFDTSENGYGQSQYSSKISSRYNSNRSNYGNNHSNYNGRYNRNYGNTNSNYHDRNYSSYGNSSNDRQNSSYGSNSRNYRNNTSNYRINSNDRHTSNYRNNSRDYGNNSNDRHSSGYGVSSSDRYTSNYGHDSNDRHTSNIYGNNSNDRHTRNYGNNSRNYGESRNHNKRYSSGNNSNDRYPNNYGSNKNTRSNYNNGYDSSSRASYNRYGNSNDKEEYGNSNYNNRYGNRH